MIPDDAILEAEPAGGIRIYDVIDLLPQKRKHGRGTRDPSDIRKLYIHHSGRKGRDGFEGLLASVRYVVYHRGFPGSYTLWFPWNRCTDAAGNLVAFRAEPDDAVTAHTGGQNLISMAIGLQGNTSTDGLSDFQKELLEGIVPWCMERYGLTHEDLFGHYEAPDPKPSCPGREAKAWLESYREMR